MTLEELLAENARLRAENEKLRAENEVLQALAKSLEERLGSIEREQKRQAAPFRRREELKVKEGDRKKPGRKPGHRGDYRRVPTRIDETVCVTLDACPHCRGPVELLQMLTQYIEELPPIKPIITRLVTWLGQCAKCGEVRSTHPLQTSLAQGAAGTHLGPRAQALAVLLNKHYHLPLRQACGVLRQGFGLSLSGGGLSQLICRVAGKLRGKYEQLIEQIRTSDAVYADETSWYVGGPGYWLWVFTTPTSTVYRIASSRGHPVAAKVLGSDFPGVLVTDCATVYDKFPGPQHKCISHHQQAIKKQQDKLTKRDDPSYLAAWKQFWKEVLELADAREQFAPEEFAARRAQFETRADELLAQEPAANGDHKVWVRMRNARKHLFGCLWHAVDPTNNRAERAIRPAVVARKISCGNKTERGAQATEILASLITTAHQQARDFLADLCQDLAITPQPVG
jgi:transposase